MFGMIRGDRGGFRWVMIRIGLAIAVGAIVGSAIAALAAEGSEPHQGAATVTGVAPSAAVSESFFGR